MLEKRIADEFGYGAHSANITRCPGMECPRVKRAAGDTLREKAETACIKGCPTCDGNLPLELIETAEIKKETKDDAVIRQIRTLRQQRRAGFAISTDEITPLEYEGLIILEELFERYTHFAEKDSREISRQSAEMFAAMMTIKK